jgi:acetylornithine deacetylase/succinyl-diaminopimelate desuccinylase-like protein
MTSRLGNFTFAAVLLAGALQPVHAQGPEEYRALARDILTELVAFETTEEAGHTVEAAEAVARRLLAAGFPEEDVRILGPRPELGSLVARYRGDGTGGRPIVLLAHVDVVPTVAELWSTDPLKLVERDGFYYGLGVGDDKSGVTSIVTNFLRWKGEGWVPSRDLIAVVSADEESNWESMPWLLEHGPWIREAAFVLNADVGYGTSREGTPSIFWVDAAEKVYADYRITATSVGGHSALPGSENAIYDLAGVLTRIGAYEFPVRVNERIGVDAFHDAVEFWYRLMKRLAG